MNLNQSNRINFRKDHKKMFLALDIAIVLVVLMNLGALLITNALVVRESPGGAFYEANPNVAERNDYAPHPGIDAQRLLNELAFYSLFWAILLTIYIFVRNRIKTELAFHLLILAVLFYVMVFSTDFVNDLGFYTGKLFWSL